MRRFKAAALYAALILLWAWPAAAFQLLPPTVLTTAVSPAQTGPVYKYLEDIRRNLTVEFIFTYGSGGTSADAYLQTSLDGGTTWVDIANFHVTTSSLSKIINLSSATPVTTSVTPTDGSMTANTALDGVLGTHVRIKYVSVGTYATSTTLTVNANSARVATPVTP